MLFQIRPAGVRAPLIDPKPILDGWVQLENTSIFRAKGKNPFLGTSPTVGQVLLESKEQLEQQVLHDPGIHIARCGRAGRPDRADRQARAGDAGVPVRLGPEADRVWRLRARASRPPDATNGAETSAGDAVDITAVNGISDRRPSGPGLDRRHHGPQAADAAGHDEAQPDLKPDELPGDRQHARASPATATASASPSRRSRARADGERAHAADAFSSAITPGQWVQLIARLGEIPDPKVWRSAADPRRPRSRDRPATALDRLARAEEEADGNG